MDAEPRGRATPENSAKAKPYGLFGLAVSLIAIFGLAICFDLLWVVTLAFAAEFLPESQLKNYLIHQIVALLLQEQDLSPAQERQGDLIAAILFDTALGLLILLVARFRARSFKPAGRVRELIGWEVWTFDRRVQWLAGLTLPYGLILSFILSRSPSSLDDWPSLRQNPLKIGLFTVVLAPLVEELTFRGWIFTSLRASFGFMTALLLSSALFASLYFESSLWEDFFVVFPTSLALGAIREWTGSIKPTIALHASSNLLAIAIDLLGVS
jgi:membrane protease YdiL (CAAX protease family)